MGGTELQLLKIYQEKIRSLVEFAVPVFHSSLTAEQHQKLEMVQKKSLAIILGKSYKSYDTALDHFKIDTLEKRRDNISLNFAVKCTRNPRHADLFPLNTNLQQNKRGKKPFAEYQCRTS